jgi:hypothetical protein
MATAGSAPTVLGIVLRHGLPCAAVWGLYLAGFWPGIMTEDSFEQWRDLVTGDFRGYHSPLQTMVNWIITRVWLSPAAIVLVQIAALTLAYCAVILECARRGAERGWLAATTVAFAALPANGFLVVTIWKDVPYTIAVLTLVALTLRLTRTPERLAGGALPWALAATLTAVATFRHNGLPTAAIFLVVLLWALRLPRRAAILVPALAVGGVLLVQVGLFRWLDVKPFHPAYRDQTVLHQVAAALRPGTAFDGADYTAITGIMPVSRWLDSYQCTTVIPTLAAALAQSADGPYRTWRPGLYRAWGHAWMRNPGVLVRHHACVSGYIWNPLAAASLVSVETVPTRFGFATQPLLPAAHDALMGLHRVTERPPWRAAVWGPALHLALVLTAAAYVARRAKHRAAFLPFVPALAHTVVLVLAVPSAEYRLQYPVVVTAIVAPLMAHVLGRGRA